MPRPAHNCHLAVPPPLPLGTDGQKNKWRLSPRLIGRLFICRHHCRQVRCDLLRGWDHDSQDRSERDHLHSSGLQWPDLCSTSELRRCDGHFSGEGALIDFITQHFSAERRYKAVMKSCFSPRKQWRCQVVAWGYYSNSKIWKSNPKLIFFPSLVTVGKYWRDGNAAEAAVI